MDKNNNIERIQKYVKTLSFENEQDLLEIGYLVNILFDWVLSYKNETAKYYSADFSDSVNKILVFVILSSNGNNKEFRDFEAIDRAINIYGYRIILLSNDGERNSENELFKMIIDDRRDVISIEDISEMIKMNEKKVLSNMHSILNNILKSRYKNKWYKNSIIESRMLNCSNEDIKYLNLYKKNEPYYIKNGIKHQIGFDLLCTQRSNETILDAIEKWGQNDKNRCMILYGQPGSGKSYTCYHALESFLEGKRFLNYKMIHVLSNVFLEKICLNTKNHNNNLLSVLNSNSYNYESFSESLVFFDIQNERFLENKNHKFSLSKLLTQATDLCRDCNFKIVFTFQSNTITKELDSVSKKYWCISIAPLNREQRLEVLYKVRPTLVDNFTDLIKNKDLDSLLAVPIIFNDYSKGRIDLEGNSLIEIYDKLFEQSSKHNKGDKKGLLEEHLKYELLAYYMLSRESEEISIKDKGLSKLWTYSDQEELSESTRVSFYHKTFYYYFLSWYLSRRIIEFRNEDNIDILKLFSYKKLEKDIIVYIHEIILTQSENDNTISKIEYLLKLLNQLLEKREYNIDNEEVFKNIIYNTLMIRNSFNDSIKEIDASTSERIINLLCKINTDDIPVNKIRIFRKELIGMTQKRIKLKESYLDSVRFEKGEFRKTECIKVTFEKCNVDRTNINSVNFQECTVVDTSISKCNFQNVYFHECSMQEVVFDGLFSDTVELCYSKCKNVSFIKSRLNNLLVSDILFDNCYFVYCDMDAATIKLSSLYLSTFNNVTSRNMDCSYSSIRLCEWENSDLSGSIFIGTNGESIRFISCNLRDVDFSNAHLKNVDFTGSDLTGSNFTHACCDKVNFDFAIVKNVIWNDSEIRCE